MKKRVAKTLIPKGGLPPAIFPSSQSLQKTKEPKKLINTNKLINWILKIFKNTLFSSVCKRAYGVRSYLEVKLYKHCDQIDIKDLEEITHIELDNTMFLPLNSNDLSGLSNLKELHLTGLSELPEKLFQGLSNLKKIDISSGNISDLPEDIFQGLLNLEEIDLSSNNISNLPKRVFKNLPSLKKVTISFNKFFGLPEDIFQGLSNVEEVVVIFSPKKHRRVNRRLELF